MKLYIHGAGSPSRAILQAISGFNFLAIRAGMTGLLLTAAVVGATCAMLSDSSDTEKQGG